MSVKSKNNEIMLTFYLKTLFPNLCQNGMYQIFEVKLLNYFFIISFDHVMPNFNKTMIYHLTATGT